MKLALCTGCGAELQLLPTVCPLCGAEIKREAVSLDGWEVERYQAEVRRLRGELGRDEPKRRAVLVVAKEDG